MKSFLLSSVLLVGLIGIPAETEDGVVYYVSPTEPISSCPGNSSCPPGQSCHTMDYLVEHNSEFFSPDHANVTLMFMCGVHNYTKNLTVQNRHSFVMKGAAESRENVIIDHQYIAPSGKPTCTIIKFFNNRFVNITNLTMRCPAINLTESHITVKNSNFYGYSGTKERLSFISIAGRGSQALLDNCTFKENCFLKSCFNDGIFVRNSTFQSYKHQKYSIIMAFSSVVTLSGNVNFTDSVIYPSVGSGTAMFLLTTHPELKFSLNIATNATVYFVNLTCSNYGGGAVNGEDGTIHIGARAKVIFMHNRAVTGGALYLTNGTIVVGSESNVVFAYNSAYYGGAVTLINSKIIVGTNTMYFYNNGGSYGGAMYLIYGTMYINSNKSVVKFMNNSAHIQGGAIYVEIGVHSFIIIDNFSKLFLLNNSAFQGGALYVVPSSFAITVRYQSSIQFIKNTASDVGGAVYAEMQSAAPCLFMVTDYSAEISFIDNHANRSVGHHMYGTSVRTERCDIQQITRINSHGKPYCDDNHEHVNISFDPGLNETLSPVSSAPKRVCLCDSNARPQCANVSQIFTDISIYRGESFMLSAHVVGYDFGTTVGVVHARFLYSNHSSQLEKLQYNQQVNNSEKCTNLEYTVFTKYGTELLLLQKSVLQESVYVAKEASLAQDKGDIRGDIENYCSHDNGCLKESLLATPIFINITLLPGCPPGLTLNHDQTTCSCYPLLANDGFKCLVKKKTGLLQWDSTAWVNATFYESHSTGIVYNRFCPLDYCKSGNKTVNTGDDPSKQCASNRTGILCGACMENFSLAIGTSRCIECPNSHYVALLLAFAAAGVLLVFFILALNLTVTQGHINGLIFYANIIWAYKRILFPSEEHENHWLTFLQVFIAWLNLDIGIEMCFFVGLDTYWKTWLQFLFPFYIWAIAGIIIVSCRYSTRLTNLIGSRGVPLLATLFLLSYMKLLRTVIDATSVAVIAQCPQNTSYAVWYLDGNLRYCQHPHIYLFIAAIATLVFLWLPYTLLLLFIQPLRRVSHLRSLKWINKLAPVYDAFFSPLKDKHLYWFGTMLLVRGILLVLLTVTSVANPELNVFVLFLFTAFLFFIISIKNVYKQINVRFLESATLLNLIVLSAGTLYKWEFAMLRMILLEVSIGITFAQFCVTVVFNLVKLYLSIRRRYRQNQGYDVNKDTDDDITHERIEDPELKPIINNPSPPITDYGY